MRYIFPCLMFLANNEVISWLALLIIMGVFLADDLWKVESDVRGECAACSVILPAHYVTLTDRDAEYGGTFLQLEREARTA